MKQVLLPLLYIDAVSSNHHPDQTQKYLPSSSNFQFDTPITETAVT